jgi:hypothetical protein
MGEDAALEDDVLMSQFDKRLSGVVRDRRPPSGNVTGFDGDSDEFRLSLISPWLDAKGRGR